MSNLMDFIDEPIWGSDSERERKNRILLSVAAYAYEHGLPEVIPDNVFDDLCKRIQPHISTAEYCTDPKQKKRYEVLDNFFRTEFKDYTGQWIYKHPEIDKIQYTYYKFYHKK